MIFFGAYITMYVCMCVNCVYTVYVLGIIIGWSPLSYRQCLLDTYTFFSLSSSFCSKRMEKNIFISKLRQQYGIYLISRAISHESAIWFIQMSSCLTDWYMVRRVYFHIFEMIFRCCCCCHCHHHFKQNSQFEMRII